jgi:hypothetical protein
MIRAGRRATSASRTAQRPGRVGATDSRRSSSGTGMSGPCSCLRRPMLDFTRRGQRLHRLMATAVRCAATSPRRMAPGRCFSQSLQGLLQRKQAHHRPIGAPRTRAHVINPLSGASRATLSISSSFTTVPLPKRDLGDFIRSTFQFRGAQTACCMVLVGLEARTMRAPLGKDDVSEGITA